MSLYFIRTWFPLSVPLLDVCLYPPEKLVLPKGALHKVGAVFRRMGHIDIVVQYTCVCMCDSLGERITTGVFINKAITAKEEATTTVATAAATLLSPLPYHNTMCSTMRQQQLSTTATHTESTTTAAAAVSFRLSAATDQPTPLHGTHLLCTRALEEGGGGKKLYSLCAKKGKRRGRFQGEDRTDN